MKYNLAVCGGTFDHFHKGHIEFLHYALSKTHKLLVGLTTDKYVKTKNKNALIEDYKIRKHNLESFLQKEKTRERVWIEPIDDIFIPKIWEELPIETIVVSENTIWGADKVNLRRKEQGKYALEIEAAPLVKSKDNEYISSSRIRNGEINRNGRSYIDSSWLNHKLFLTEKLRGKLKKPFGTLIRKNTDYGSFDALYVITVGDVTTKTFNKLHLDQNISVVDFKVARQKKFSSIKELGFSGKEKVVRVSNPSGYLTPDLFKAVLTIFKQRKNRKSFIIQVDGEEDLSVLALTLAVPLDSLIFYGQPEEGLVKVYVSEEIKEKAYNFVSQFKAEAT